MAGLNELYNDEKYIVSKKKENNINKINEEKTNKKLKIDEK